MKRYEIGLIIGLVLTALIWESPFIYGQQPINTNQPEDKAAQIRKKLAEQADQIRKNIEENGDPIADFNAPEPTDPNELENRKKRNKKYNNPNKPETVLRLNEKMNPISLGGWTKRIPDPAFPKRSNFVAIGRVTSANAFVSDDKSNIYSEFNFQTAKILKNTTNIQIQEKEQITLNRLGGKVRFPSGRVIFNGTDGLYMPRVDREYLMFLNYDSESNTYEIITGYEFIDGKVNPLDGLNYLGDSVERYQNYQKYRGEDVELFVKIVTNSFTEIIL